MQYGLSEEKPVLNDLGGKEFIVTFDPLDGSSIIGTNFTVGTIFGIWPSDERKLQKMQVKDQISAGAVMVTPRAPRSLASPRGAHSVSFLRLGGGGRAGDSVSECCE